MNNCPLCKNNKINKDYHSDKLRQYYQCLSCQLVIVPKQFHLSEDEEKALYDIHQNNPEDLGYRQFLSRTIDPLLIRLSQQKKEDQEGLDFGCGPGPVIREIAKEDGITVYNYDPIYYPFPELLKDKYDFIIMTEVIEHVSKPLLLLNLLASLMKSNATLAVMTKRVSSQERFKNWHYKNDPTHICFYSMETFSWIASKFKWQLEEVDKDVVFFYP
ncbi:MAG: class I SAM-dependent methyltransferase [Gammaproteobacteria bacterium]|nr:class I SAM-dependent methyltransferase [Gammaproteobacteria bacterium]